MSKSTIQIGTSGYTYSWNEKRPSPFTWYVKQGFNSVEINASYIDFQWRAGSTPGEQALPKTLRFQ